MPHFESANIRIILDMKRNPLLFFLIVDAFFADVRNMNAIGRMECRSPLLRHPAPSTVGSLPLSMPKNRHPLYPLSGSSLPPLWVLSTPSLGPLYPLSTPSLPLLYPPPGPLAIPFHLSPFTFHLYGNSRLYNTTLLIPLSAAPLKLSGTRRRPLSSPCSSSLCRTAPAPSVP